MAVKIPYNVEKEDKLIGPLTLKQFLYVVAGAGIGFGFYELYRVAALSFFGFVILTFLVALFVASLAFFKINGLPFLNFLANLVIYLFSPKVRIWQKKPSSEALPLKVKDATIKTSKEEAKEIKKEGNIRSQLEILTSILDSGGKIKPGDLNKVSGEIANILQGDEKSRLEYTQNVEDVLSKTD